MATSRGGGLYKQRIKWDQEKQKENEKVRLRKTRRKKAMIEQFSLIRRLGTQYNWEEENCLENTKKVKNILPCNLCLQTLIFLGYVLYLQPL